MPPSGIRKPPIGSAKPVLPPKKAVPLKPKPDFRKTEFLKKAAPPLPEEKRKSAVEVKEEAPATEITTNDVDSGEV